MNIGEAKHILKNSLLKSDGYERHQQAIETVLAELEKKDEDIQRMQELLDISDANNVKKDLIIKEMVRIDPHIYRMANIRLEEREGK